MRNFLLILAATFFFSGNGFATKYSIAKNTNTVIWTAVGFPGFLRINGEGGQVAGQLVEKDKRVTGTLTVDLRKFVTGIEARDGHMHQKYLETEKYPYAELVVTDYSLGTSEFAGKLTIKGETKPVKGEAVVKCGKGSCGVAAKFVIKITDYPAIGVPAYLGVTVAEKVDVEVNFVALPEK